MKLLDLFLESSPFKIQPDGSGQFKKEQLEQIKEILPAFDEFKDCGSDFTFTEYPVFTTRDAYGKEIPTSTQIHKAGENFRIPKGAVIYAISRSPEIYKDEDLKLRVGITPTIYDPADFVPYKYITLKYSVEFPQDLKLQANMSEEDADKELRSLLHQQLDMILDNPDQYKPKPSYFLFVRMWHPKEDGQA
jgi:hypothetical protein